MVRFFLRSDRRAHRPEPFSTYRIVVYYSSTFMLHYLHNLISVQSTTRTRSRSAVILARPSVSSSLQITNRSFTYASPYLWNQLPSSFRQPHSVHCLPGSPRPAHITSPHSPPSLSSPITASTFPSSIGRVFLVPFGLLSRILALYQSYWALAFVCFSFFSFHFFLFLVTCATARLS